MYVQISIHCAWNRLVNQDELFTNAKCQADVTLKLIYLLENPAVSNGSTMPHHISSILPLC